MERASVIGSAYKRKAAIFANRVIAGDTAAATVKEFNNAVRESIAAYEIGSGESTDERFDPYPALNGLALKALEGPYKQGALECAACAGKANDRFKHSPDVWNAVMAADAYLVESLCSGALGDEDGKSEKAFEEVSRRYSEALAHIQIAPKDLDSVTQQLCLLALLFDAKAATRIGTSRGKADTVIAQRLRRLADTIRPGSCTAANNSRPKTAKQKPPLKKHRVRAVGRRAAGDSLFSVDTGNHVLVPVSEVFA